MDVTIISFEGNSIIISTKTPLPDTIGKARLENGATVLMERLIKCIEKNAKKGNPVGNRMLPNDGSAYVAKKIFEYKDLSLKHGNNTPSQNNAIISALSNDITYIWGPPGTGKTTVIGQIIDELYKHNRSVLVVSHTNTAVDGAIEKADRTYSNFHVNNDENYPILRIGIPTRPLSNRVLLTQHVAVLGKEMYEQKALLEKQQAKLQHRINEIRLLIIKDNWLKENNLENIRKTLRSIAKHEKEIEEIQHRIEIINTLIKKEKVAHPEYAKYLVLSKKLKEKKSNYDAICRQVEKNEGVISNLSAQKNFLFKELCELELQQKLAKPTFVFLREFGKKLQQEKRCLINAKEQREKENDDCAELIKKEYSLCSSFFHEFDSEDITVLFEELSKLFESVRVEIASIDMESIHEEKKVADQQLHEILHQLNDLNQKMQELEKQAIMSAKIVGTTLAKSYLNETLRERDFDTVILDEASMASIPALWCASYLAKSNIVIVGDFLQLPPIVMADTPMAKKWLGKDIFYHSGMQELAKNKKTCPDNFIMLNNQFRMESDIADIANMYYGAYGGLCSDDQNQFRVKDREKFYSWYSPIKHSKKNIHLIDTKSLHAWVTGVPQGKGLSRLNCFSAILLVDLAFKFLENKLRKIDPRTAKPEKKASVLIVAPYKAHVTRVNQLIDLEYRNRNFKENLNFIKVGTIHSFQGSEADIVIFDLVIDEPHWKANLFITDMEVNKNLRKMFNVAITRARYKLYIVGNFAYCQKRAKNNALSELLDKLIKKDRLVPTDAKTLLPEIVFTRQSDFDFDGNLTGKHIVCRENVFNNYFMADIHSFKKRLIIYSAFMTEARLSMLLPAFSDAIRAGKQIIVVTKALSDRGKSELMQYKKCEKELRDIGVNVLHKKSMHEKLIFIDSNAVWIGSLNALSFTGRTGEVMQRHADGELTAEYEKLFDIEHICSAIENEYEQKCPICGNEMIAKESDGGGIYWQCIAGDYSRDVNQQYPLDGIIRCKCGAPYVFSMKNEPRWICSENPKHYQRMRENDLKLEKMAVLIPTKKARKEVERYFLQKRKERESMNKVKKKTTATSAKKKSVDKTNAEQLKLF